jgi:hypothetical protein
LQNGLTLVSSDLDFSPVGFENFSSIFFMCFYL